MTDTPFSNREILSMFQQQKDNDKETKAILLRIEKNTEKIEERVTNLEKRNEKRDGASAILKLIGMVVIGSTITYLGWVGMQIFSITQTLSEYDVTIEP